METEYPNQRGSAARAIGIDVGGSAIKAATFDLDSGSLPEEVIREPAPAGFAADAVIPLIAVLAERLGPDAPVGVGFPAIVKDGVLLTDPTSLEHPGWAGIDLRREISERLGRPVSVANDADVAALAEYRFGAARGASGTVLVLTLGTGIGSGLLRDGRLFPNVELGRIYLAGHDRVAEEHCSARIRTEQGLGWDEYSARLQEYLDHVERITAPDLIVLGGAVSREADRFLPLLETRAPLVPASLFNEAGIAGAALLPGLDGFDPRARR